MMYEPFHKYNMDTAQNDQFVLCKQYDNPKIENDYFAFFESYCSDQDCDCRHVYLDVMKKGSNDADSRLIGKISFGLDTLQFHLKWFHTDKPDKNHLEYIGPSIIEVYDTGEKENLQDFINLLKEDESHKEKFKRHYLMHKKSLNDQSQEDRQLFLDNKIKFETAFNELTENNPINKINKSSLQKRLFNAMKSDSFKIQGRNELCNCGSSLKYKRCCGKI